MYIPGRSKELNAYFLHVEHEGCMCNLIISLIALGRCKNSVDNSIDKETNGVSLYHFILLWK